MKTPTLLLSLTLGTLLTSTAAEFVKRDVCVYGSSPAAMTAALQVRAQGRSVALIVPGQHIGGMLVEGLGSQDVNNNGTQNELVISGLSKEFYQRIGAKYGKAVQYRFEPKIAQATINEWLIEAGVDVFRGNRLAERFEAVQKDGTEIVELEMENGNRFRAEVFIDGTIEGDLMKWAGVSYVVGRESNATYGETLNGIRNGGYRQFAKNVDPYIVPGNPASGLIATIQDEPLGTLGAADDNIMGFCFRQTLTKTAGNKITITQPADYDPANYEIYRRYLAAGGSLYSPSANLPNGKTDLGSWHDLSGNLYGYSKGWPDGTYSQREAIYTYHKNFIQGLYWFLANDPAVPLAVRNNWSQWGLAADEFTDNGGWPRSLYIRSGRRMVSDYVITEADTKGQTVAADSICVAWWPPDMHHARRIVQNGRAFNEGFVFASDYVPFPISYRSIVPKRSEATNLLVPAALSSSYVGYGSVRLEWNQMICGQSAGAAAVEALRTGDAVQDVDYARLRPVIKAAGLVLEVPDTLSLPGGTIVDNSDASQFSQTGTWVTTTSVAGYVGSNYLHDNNSDKGSLSATFQPLVATAGSYLVYGRWSSGSTRSSSVPVTITHAAGQTDITVDQQQNGNQWNLLGTFVFAVGSTGSITYKNVGTSGFVIVDAIQLVPVGFVTPAVVSVTPTVSTTSESGPAPGRFSIVREGNLSSAVVVNYTLDGSATSGSDYTSVADSVTLGSGVAAATVNIAPIADALAEGTETVILTLQSGSGYTLGAAASATVEIEDKAEQAWQFRNFTPAERIEGILNAMDADPDQDGRNNLLEMFAGTNPRAAENSAAVQSLTVTDNGPNKTLSLYFRKSGAAGNVTAAPEGTSDLVSPWAAPALAPVVVGWDAITGDPWMRSDFTFTYQGFVRLRVNAEP